MTDRERVLEQHVARLESENKKLMRRLSRATLYTKQNLKSSSAFARYLIRLLDGTLDNG